MSDQEFVHGYMDGRNPNAPEPSDNRSHRYRHSFAVGRRELRGETPVRYDDAMAQAAVASAKDEAA